MKITYNEILNNMKSAYFERCGEQVKTFGDTAARLEAAASELFSLACENEFVLRQAFPQTATGEYLDFHAALRDIFRKQPSQAQGTLTFTLSEAAQDGISVPEGVICSKTEEPFIQFITTQSAVIPAGETEINVPARALESGEEYNASAYSVTVMVNPPAGVDGVTNKTAFCGGCGAETDEMLRKRILESYGIMQSGYTLESLREGVMRNENVLDCSASYYNNALKLLVRLKAGTDFQSASAEITDSLGIVRLVDCDIDVVSADESPYSLTLEIKSDGSGTEEIINAVKTAVSEYARGVRIGQDVSLNGFVYAASAVDGVRFCEASSPQALSGTVICPADSYLSLDEIRVSCYD